ncbi:MAG: hypothetical protein ACR2P1_25645 [Pseudomonadales bacterium]
MTNSENYGYIERPIALFIANLKAVIYCLKCPLAYQVRIENTWVEDRNKRDELGDPMYREHITFIGVIDIDENMRPILVKTFFGKPRFL